ncbi:MAG: ABC transporter permease [Bacteroidota bacterium]
MNNLWIILRREYLVRVRHKYFLLATFLAPVGLLLLMVLPSLLFTLDLSDRLDVLVYDPSGQVSQRLVGDNAVNLIPFDGTPAELKDSIRKAERLGGLILPEDLNKQDITVTFLSNEKASLSTESSLKKKVQSTVEEIRLMKAGVQEDELENVAVDLDWSARTILKEGEKETNSVIGTIFGYGMGALIYFLIAIYGSMVMRGVLEEKTSRIVEVMVSSVKPIHLMFGKILGVVAVGLTQFVLWILLSTVLLFTVVPLVMPDNPEAMQAQQQEMSQDDMEQMALEIQQAIDNFNGANVVYFILFFLGGFLLYGSLYAAIAASADQESDVQSLSAYITIPLIIPLVMLGAIINDPNGTLAVVMSYIPFFSPITMMARAAATDVPTW